MVGPQLLLLCGREIIKARFKRGSERYQRDINMPLYIIYLFNPYFKLLKNLNKKKYDWRKNIRIIRRPIKNLLEVY